MLLKTTSEVIDAVGGTRAFAQWLGVDDRAVSMWRRPDRRFPASKYLAMKTRLKKEFGIEAPDELWGQERP